MRGACSRRTRAVYGFTYAFPNLRRRPDLPPARRKILRVAAAAASARQEERSLQPLPTTTPHTLRRTNFSIAQLANGFDVKWVMSQVGHADSKMTLDVYAQLEQRAERSHGPARKRRSKHRSAGK